MTTPTTLQNDPAPEQVEAAFDREEREDARIAELAAADAERTQPGLGFVGCAKSGRVLRVRVANRTRQRMSVKCPHCDGAVHSTNKAMARELLEDEREPELVELPPTELERDLQDRGAGRRQVSDATIFDTFPVGREVVAADAAKKLGYAAPAHGSRAASLLVRLRRMNSRAAKERVPAPFTFTRRQLGAGGLSIIVSRAAGGTV
jgi:hypothetical protein